MTTVSELVAAGAIRSVFQPIVDLDTGAAVAYEALARGPEGPLARPDALFAAARRDGCLARLDEACRVAAFQGAVEQALLAPLTLFVNVEPEVLQTAPLDDLLAIARDAPRELRVVMEITERALAVRPADLLRTVDRVRELGWGVALDDVGADTLSLAFMPLLQPDVVKLDLRLVQERPGAAVAQIMNAVNAYAERTGALVLAEGIEDARHLTVARALGARLGQGWLFGRPGPGAAAGYDVSRLVLPSATVAGRVDASPFACLPPGTVLRRSPKALLIELSKQLEREAVSVGETCVVAATFQEARHFTAATARRYRELVGRTGFVCALGEGLSAEPLPGLRGATLSAADPVRGEWDLTVLGPHFAAALLARDLGDTGPEDERTFEYALTYRRDTVIRATNALLARVVPRPPTAPCRPSAAPATRVRSDPPPDAHPLVPRHRLEEQVEVALWEARSGDRGVALLLVEPADGLDEQGLLGVAERLRSRLRRGDLLVRPRRDAFLVLLPDLDAATAPAEARRVADELVEALRLAPDRVRIGISAFPADGADVPALLHRAGLGDRVGVARADSS